MINSFARFRKQLMSLAGFAVFTTPIIFGLLSAKASGARTPAQNIAAPAPALEYEVATIKAYKPGAGEGPGMMRVGIMNAPDGFTASGATMQMLVGVAYGVQSFQITGAPDWFDNDRFEISAKMESSVADALAKMSQDDRTLARQKMLQALLADRFKLTIRRETKELPAYVLTVAKNGTKLVEAKPVDPAASVTAAGPGAGAPGRGGPGRGAWQLAQVRAE
jgi:uncharacterized protein (TIGR03435 family)